MSLKIPQVRTLINQIRQITVASSTGSGIPKAVTGLQVSLSNASTGATSVVTIQFSRPSDASFNGVVIYARGYQGNNGLVQVGSSADSPATFILNNTGERVALSVQSRGNGGVTPLGSCPTTAIQLPKGKGGGVGTQTTTQLVTVTPAASTITAGSAALLVSSPSTFTLNLTTEGTKDWIAQTGATGASLPNFEVLSFYTWKTGGWSNGKFRPYGIFQQDNPTMNTQTSSPLILSATDVERAFNGTRDANFISPNVTGSAVDLGHGMELPGTGSSQTYKLYAYLSKRCNISAVAHATDGTTGDVTLTASESTTQGTIYTFTFTAKIPVGQSILFRVFTTALNAGDTFAGVCIQAITVF